MAAARDGAPVAVVTGDGKTTKPAVDWLTAHGWPVPMAAKPKADKAAAKTRATKAPVPA